MSDRRAAAIEGSSDAEIIFALLLDRLDAGVSPPDALTDILQSVPGRLNMILTDGQSVWATKWGDTLWTVPWGGGHVVASEPLDDRPGWSEVAEQSLVTASAQQCLVSSVEQGAFR